MLNNKIIMFLIFLLGLGNTMLYSACDPLIKQQIKLTIKDNPYALYGYIDSAKIAAFVTDDLIKSGFDEEAVQKWDSWLACCHDYIQDQLNHTSGVPKIYKSYITQLEHINSSLKNFIMDFHAQYQDGTLKKSDLEKAKEIISSYSKQTADIFAYSLRTIATKLPLPDAWKKSVGATLESVLPGYELFFQSFDKAKNQLTKGKMTPLEIHYYLRQVGVIKVPYNPKKDLELEEEKAATMFFDKLEKFAYRLNGEIIKQKDIYDKTPFYRKSSERKKLENLQTMFTNSQDIMAGLLSVYARMFPLSYLYKLQDTKDASSLIILAEAGSLNSILQALKRNIVSQINALK